MPRSEKIRRLSAERLRYLLDYDPITGLFTWKITKSGWIGKGKIAGSTFAPNKSLTKYTYITIDKIQQSAHQLAWLYVTGEHPDEGIDHIDGDGTNNAFHNLRLANASQQQWNKGVQSNSKSGLRGVRQSPNGKWTARIRAAGKCYNLGSFPSKEAAAAEYATAALKLYGEFRRV